MATPQGWQMFDGGTQAAIVNGDWSVDNHYAILVDENYTFLKTHSTVADVVANEVTDLDYDPVDITGATDAQVVGSPEITQYDCDDIAFGDPKTIAAAGIIICMGTAGAKTNGDAIVAYSMLDKDEAGDPVLVSVTGSEFTVQMHPDGFARLQPVA